MQNLMHYALRRFLHKPPRTKSVTPKILCVMRFMHYEVMHYEILNCIWEGIRRMGMKRSNTVRAGHGREAQYLSAGPDNP